MHRDEIPVNAELVRELVDSQFPQYARLPLRKLAASGSSNVQFRLGDDLLVRLPRLPGGGASIEREEHWTAIIGGHLPVAVPEFVESGAPALGFSEQWSIVRWLDGEHPLICESAQSSTINRSQLAKELASVVLAFRSIDVPQDAAADEQLRNYRGRALAHHDRHMRRNLEQCKSIVALASI